MKKIPLDRYLPGVSRLAYGCMGLGGGDGMAEKDAVLQAENAIDAALASGINFFDHADIYCGGRAESVFGKVLKARPSLRKEIFLQSKCAIRLEDKDGPKRYDFSAEYIGASVDGILARLNCDFLDVLVLHRPDPLMEGEEVAAVFDALLTSGKVRHFGVSNMHREQVLQLQSFLQEPLVVNQIELSLQRLDFVDEAVYAGNPRGAGCNFEAGTLEYCARNHVQVQSWGSLCQGLFSGADLSNAAQSVKNTAALVARLAQKYEVSQEAIVLAWLTRHPAAIQPIIGSTHPARISACADIEKVKLSRGDWYALYVSARGEELP